MQMIGKNTEDWKWVGLGIQTEDRRRNAAVASEMNFDILMWLTVSITGTQCPTI